jgi:hypothetical protein
MDYKQDISMNKQNSKFYKFGSKLTTSAVQVTSVNLGNDDYQRLILGRLQGIKTPMQWEQKYGHEFQDILDTGYAGLYLVSDKLKEVLIENSITGWIVFDVEIFDNNGESVRGYNGFSITGRSGPIDYHAGKAIQKQFTPNGPLITIHRGYGLDLSNWDGSDFFIPVGQYGTYATSKVFELIKSNKLSNIKFQDIAEMEISDFDIQVFTENREANIRRFLELDKDPEIK